MPINHLAIFHAKYLKLIMKGEKKIETRFSKNRCAPYKQIKVNDIIYLKETGREVLGRCVVASVKFFELDNAKYFEVVEKYNSEACLDPEWIKKKKDSKYATLIWITEVRELHQRVEFKQEGQLSWIVGWNPIPLKKSLDRWI
jgi:ASC-1-like (ASCH) protein